MAESLQDHLEFSHPYFVRDHPDLLANIKRKVGFQKIKKLKVNLNLQQSTRNVEPNMSVQTQVSFLFSLREKERGLENEHFAF